MNNNKPNLMGSYGAWLESYVERKPILSMLGEEQFGISRPGESGTNRGLPNGNQPNIEGWKEKARNKFKELIGYLTLEKNIRAKVVGKTQYDGLIIEEIVWQMPFGPETHAYFLRPEKYSGTLPGILALHDHGGFKYFGKEKITQTDREVHPSLRRHWDVYYSGRAWANEIAKRGFGVLVPDVFTFGSRRINPVNLPKAALNKYLNDFELFQRLKKEEKKDAAANSFATSLNDVSQEQIDDYNEFAKQYEHVIAKSLFSAGTTWPALFIADDQAALSYLCSRPEINESRIGCCGLSGGGLRTNYLSGIDDRIKCSVTAGFMSTWRDFALNMSYAHTWMLYVPHLINYLDFPEILGMRVPLPSMVLSTYSDPLYTSEETERADKMLSEIYERADALDRLKISWHQGPHYFNEAMQEEAFSWLERWLK